MAARKLKTKAIERNEYKIYLKKAGEFYETMLQAKTTIKWNAVGLNAVHCAISASDALLVFYAGIRSAGDDHLSAINLLAHSVDIPDHCCPN